VVMVETETPANVDERDPEVEFAEFFSAEYRGLVRGLRLLTADPEEAEELAQEAMARAYEQWDRIGHMDSPGGYVYRTAVNLNRKRLRHLAVRARRRLAIGAREEALGQAEVEPVVKEAIASLSRGQREAFMLVEWFGMSSEEAGLVLGIAPASVRSQVHRARTTLRRRLVDEGDRDD
jgi:RNA polymerase sigma-70 factor (ECF subfamily)